MKLFQIGFNKCGTEMINALLQELGYETIHWDQGRLAIRMLENWKNCYPILKGYEDYECYLDMENVDENLYAHLLFYPYLDAQYPNSKFLLNTGDVESWLERRRSHPHYLERAMKASGITTEKEMLEHWRQKWNHHHTSVLNYFYNNNNLCLFHYEHDSLQSVLTFLFPELHTKFNQVLNDPTTKRKIAFILPSLHICQETDEDIHADAIYNYADGNEYFLENLSIIFVPQSSLQKTSVKRSLKFWKRFPVIYFPSKEDLYRRLHEYKITHLYTTQNEQEYLADLKDDDSIVKCLHYVSPCTKDSSSSMFRYDQIAMSFLYNARRSIIDDKWKALLGRPYPILPYMIRLFQSNRDYRLELKIPNDATVIGYFGQYFHDIDENVKNNTNPNIYFLFEKELETPKMLNYSNCRFISTQHSHLEHRRRVLNTCNAYIHTDHGVNDGYSNYIAILTIIEFLMLGKPVLIYNGNGNTKDEFPRHHTCFQYCKFTNDLDCHLQYLDKYKYGWNESHSHFFSDSFHPENIMREFNSVFLEGYQDIDDSINPMSL